MNGGATHRTVVWAALFAGPLAYAGIVLAGVIPPRAGGLPPLLWPVLGAAALGAVVASRLLWARLVAGAESDAVRGVSPPAAGADPVLPRAIVVWALDESVALLGFVLAWLGAPIVQVAPFFVLSVVLLATDHPGRLS